MKKLKDIKIHETMPTNMGGIRVSAQLIGNETIDDGTIDKDLGLDSSGNPVKGSGVGGAVDVSEIDSGTATSGQVLIADGDGGAEWGNIPVELPATPADASEKTYVLKLVNGTLTWVEEVAA